MRIPIAREGYPFILVSVMVALVLPLAFGAPLLRWPLWAAALFTVAFFRDPDRRVVRDASRILSPADGTVMRIEEVEETTFFKGPARLVAIFMSPFNCHINRAPIGGAVVFKQYFSGQFYPAYREKESELNERNLVGIENDRLKVLVRQIAGVVARRIVCRVNVSNELEQGERFGLIRFGSRCDLYLPREVEVVVRLGEKVKGGLSTIGIVREAHE